MKENKERNGRVNGGGGRGILLIFALVIALAVLGFAGFSLRNLVRYENAISLLREAKYPEAAEAFGALGAYRDSASYLMYSKAARACEEGDFPTASENLKALKDFGDSAVLALYCDARAYEEAELYESAAPIYDQISLYRDAAERRAALPGKALERDYQAACALREKGDYQAAIRAFRALEDYRDSRTQADKTASDLAEAENAKNYEAADALYRQGSLQEAREAFLRLGDYRDSAARAADVLEQSQALSYEAAAAAEEAGNVTEAYEGYLSLGDYKDSASKAAALENEYGYRSACSLAMEGRYGDALAAYEALGDYRDSAVKAEILAIGRTARLTPVGSGLISFRLGSGTGLINLNTNRVTAARYDSMDAFDPLGLARVSLNGRYGFIDDTGDEVIPLDYSSADAFDANGLSRVRDFSGRYGFIGRGGESVIPCEYEALSAFSGSVCVARKDGLIGILDTRGGTVADTAYRRLGDTSCDDTVLAVPAPDGENRLRAQDPLYRFALMDGDYRVLGEFDWDEIGAFTEGLARVRSGQYYGFIDAEGQIAVPPEWPWADRFSGGLCAVAGADGRYGYIDKNGELVIPAIYADAARFNGGLAAVCLPGVGWYMIDREGNNTRFAVIPYEKAEAALENGDYEAAAAGFGALGNYADSYERMLESYYRLALSLRDSGDSLSARQLAEDLSVFARYRDSADLAKAIEADELFASGMTAEAWALYAGVDESLRRHQDDYQAMFEAADALLLDRKYDEAIAAFRALGGYGESAARIEAAYDGKYQAEYAAALALMEEKKYDEAVAGFEALGEYSRAQEMAMECGYLKALADAERGTPPARRGNSWP